MNALLKISVIIPTRNCLTQVLQSLPRIKEWLPLVGEVIVVDSHSSDGTREALERHITGGNVRFIDHPPGLYASWNAGIRAATRDFIHFSTAGDTISTQDLVALLDDIETHQTDIVCAPPQFLDLSGRPVEGPTWPVHSLGGQRLDGLDLLAVAMKWCQVPLRYMSWLGSSASNLYRRTVFASREFPTDTGHSGDMMFGLRHAHELSAYFCKEKRGQFVLHESSASRADLFDSFGETYASVYAAQRSRLLGSLSLKHEVREAISFDAVAVHQAFAKERQATQQERSKKEKLQHKIKSDPQALVVKFIKQRLKRATPGIGFFEKRALRSLLNELSPAPKAEPAPEIEATAGHPVQEAKLIITSAEINDRHGTGVLLKRLFPRPADVIHLRSMDLYGGETSGALSLRVPSGSAHELPALLRGSTVRYMLAVPYSRSDVENTLAAQEATGAPLIVWLMDHHLGEGEHQIPPQMMQILLDRAQLRLGISPEFCTLYEQLFGRAIYFAPPVVDERLLQIVPLTPAREDGALLGNLWSQRWLEKLALHLRVPVTSYGHHSPQWVKHDALAAHVTMRGFLPEPELVQSLRQHAYAIVPTGTLDASDDLPDIARYSLPSRTLYLTAIANLPIIVLGHADTGVARFVTRHGLGVVADYENLNDAISKVRNNEATYRQRAAELAPLWARTDMQDWLWQSLETGQPVDTRWQSLI
jgi:hypothetical protein